jgi:hypothetical protein
MGDDQPHRLVRGQSRRPDEWPSIRGTSIRSAPLTARARRARARRRWRLAALALATLAAGLSVWLWAWPSIADFMGGH